MRNGKDVAHPESMVTLRLRLSRANAEKVKSFVTAIEAESESDSISYEAFFDKHFSGKTEQEITLAGYRYREDLTQQQLTELTGINRRHISEYGTWQASYRQGFTLRLSQPVIGTGNCSGG